MRSAVSAWQYAAVSRRGEKVAVLGDVRDGRRRGVAVVRRLARVTAVAVAWGAVIASSGSAAWGAHETEPDVCTGVPLIIGYLPVCAGDVPRLLTNCHDGIDNDRDGRVDYRADGSGDPGCTGELDNERGTVACDNGIDDDGEAGYYFDYRPDGWEVYGDPGCSSPTDDSEKGSTVCDDGLDNDGDGRIDYGGGGPFGATQPADRNYTRHLDGPGCNSPHDDTE